MKNLNESKFLHEKVKYVLLKEWDPIGINSIEEAQDEYDGYIPALVSMLNAGKNSEEILHHLCWIEIERMGLAGNIEHTRKIAEKLCDLVCSR
jgi:hypothetical protein